MFLPQSEVDGSDDVEVCRGADVVVVTGIAAVSGLALGSLLSGVLLGLLLAAAASWLRPAAPSVDRAPNLVEDLTPATQAD